jgi:hypothetical protein
MVTNLYATEHALSVALMQVEAAEKLRGVST